MMRPPNWKDKLYDALLVPLLMFCLFAPPLILPIAQRIPVKGPLFTVSVSVALLLLWARFGLSPIHGQIDGIISVLVVLINLSAIVVEWWFWRVTFWHDRANAAFADL